MSVEVAVFGMLVDFGISQVVLVVTEIEALVFVVTEMLVGSVRIGSLEIEEMTDCRTSSIVWVGRSETAGLGEVTAVVVDRKGLQTEAESSAEIVAWSVKVGKVQTRKDYWSAAYCSDLLVAEH